VNETVDYERVGDAYLKERTLERTAGPVLLWGLGVGYVISGDFFGWNFGLNAGGFGGLFVAVLVMATLYVSMIFSLAELATMMPVAGGPYAFARRALGPWGGWLTGLAVTIEYVVAPAVIATGIGGYVAGMFDDPPRWVAAVVPVLAYAIFVGASLLGSRFSLRLLFVITGVSVLALLGWAFAVVPHVSWDRVTDIAPTVPSGTPMFPHGLEGIVAALPAAGWFYLAVEGVPLAAEETRDPARDLPRGMIGAMLSLVVFSLLVLVLAPAVGGAANLATSENPLPAAAEAALGRGVAYWGTTVVGLAGLVASFFGIIFAYSRQIFALSRAGYFPRWLSRTNRHRAPHWALVVPAIIGFGLILVIDLVAAGAVKTADLLMQIAVFAALSSYAMMMVSHLVLRRRDPHAPRPYRTPLYPLPPIVALVLALVAMSSTLFYGEAALLVIAGALGVVVAGALYFGLYSRHHLVASAPEEEAALVRAAEAELE
jgi:ethanolamine permease